LLHHWDGLTLFLDDGRVELDTNNVERGIRPHLGYSDRALKTAQEALSLAREVSHPFSIVLALAYLAMLHQFRREPEAAPKTAEEARRLCQEYLSLLKFSQG
jgi:hypothetical protein